MKYLIYYTLFLLVIFSLGACESKEDQPEFDRTAFLENYAQNIIQPTAAALLSNTEQLATAINAFAANQSAENLETAQATWDATYRVWMRANSFNFGPGGSERLRRTILEEIGTFPVDVEDIEEKIASENPEFDDSKRRTRGLLGLEYLLFGETDNANVLAGFDKQRIAYLQQLMDKLLAQVQAFDTAWQGTYANEFITNDGTDVKSAAVQMFSEFIRSYEAIRDFKLGQPLGVIAGQTKARPEYVEARFSKNSLEYAILNYQAIVDLWYGRKADGTDGIGWQEYLLSVEGGQELVADIIAQFEKIQAAIDNLPKDKSLQTLATEGNEVVINFQEELQELSRFFKSDMSSLLSLAVTFSIIDGD
ncbi:MAG: imelysin family protein [Bacteroidota bacterium]